MTVPSTFQRVWQAAQRGWAFLRKGPAYVGAFAGWQARRWARRRRLLPRPWQAGPAALWTQLDARRAELAPAVQAARRGETAAAQGALHAYFRQRPAPRFFFTWADRPALQALIPPAAQAATLAAAEQVVNRTFEFRGQPPVTFAAAVDWAYCPADNTDWRWDLNRHFYFVTLGQAAWYSGDPRYAQAFADLLEHWLAHNPPDEQQPNWREPFEVACRVITWLWAYHLFVPAGLLTDAAHARLLGGLWAHGVYLETCLEVHVPNNHLLLEAKALYMLGLLLPEFRAAGRWRERGRRILAAEVARQVCADGTHAERAPHYHRLIAGELLELLILLERNAVRPAPHLLERWTRMLEFDLALTRPDGRFPLFGDSAHDDPHLRFAPAAGGAAWLGRPEWKRPGAALETWTSWLVGPEGLRRFADLPAQAPAASVRFPHGGYAVLRSGGEPDGRYLALDCGPFGYALAAGHGHADALSFELFADGRELILDPGVYSYHLGAAWRNYFRGTAAHNTVLVDGQDQSVLAGEWRVLRPAQARWLEWLTSAAADYVAGEHDGYQRLPEPITHRRRLLFVKPDYWVLSDQLLGRGRHRFDWHFHLPPEAEVCLTPETGLARVQWPAGPGLLIGLPPQAEAEVITGRSAPLLGWVSRRSGEKQAAPVLRLSLTAAAPVQLTTVLYPVPDPGPARLRVERLADDQDLVDLRIETAAWHDAVLLDGRARPERKTVAGHTTTARLAHLRWAPSGGAPLRIWEHT